MTTLSKIHPSLWPGTIIGFVRGQAVYAIGGGDGAGDPDEGGGDEADDDEEPEVEDDGYTPPTKAEYEAMQERIRKNNQENKNHRLTAKQLKELGIDGDLKTWFEARGIDPAAPAATGQEDPPEEPTPKAKAGPTKAEVRAIQQAAAQAAESATANRYKPVLAQMALKDALAEAGWIGEGVGPALRMIDLDEVDVDSDGNITGIAEQVAELKADLPSLFKRAAPKRRGAAEPKGTGAGAVDGGDKGRQEAKTASWLDQVDAQLTGRGV